jgi:probable HAF family extracellular repeat protein
MKTVSLALALLTACGVSHDTDDPEGSPPTLPAPNGSPTAIPSAYRLVPVPSGIAFGTSTASKLVCSDSTVVGSQDVAGGGRAIVFDYRTSITTDLGTLGGSISTGRAGNASGTFVGSSTPAMGGGRAFVHRDGIMSALPGIGGNESSAHAINAQGQIVGQAQVPGTGDVAQHAILWEPDCMAAVDLGTLDGDYSFAREINNAGVIVGVAVDGNNAAHAVMWGSDRVLVDLGTGGARDAQATDINATGLIAGWTSSPNSPSRAVVIDDGQFVDLGTLGGSGAQALALNDRGDVVGNSSLQFDQVSRAFLYSNGAMVNLAELVDAPGWQLVQANDICDNGVIAGNGLLDGRTRGFVLIPNE